MATTLSIYNHTHRILCCDGSWSSDTIKLALVAGYYFNATHTIFGDYSSWQNTDASYTQGGQSLTSKTRTNSVLDADDVSWPMLNLSFNCGLLYLSGTAEGLTDPLLACITFDTIGDTVTVTNENFNVIWNASGIFSL